MVCMELHEPTLLAFEDVAIDLAGRRLLRGGVEQPLEPKAYGVLALLASAPGHVFTRDEILDAVWGHRHVTPGVLNRVMTLLRHALGEDAQGARYLHTVHGVGYRFDLPEAAPRTSARAPAPETTPVETLSPKRRVDDGPRGFSRIVLWSLPLLALLALGGWMLWLHSSTTPAPTATATAITVPATERSIAVLPLANASRDPDQQFFSDGLSDSLIDALSRFEGLRVIGRMSSFRFRDGKDDSKSIGAKLGATYLLNGSVQRAGDVVRINTTLTRAADGSTLWAEHYDRPYKDLFALQDDIARSVARALQARLLAKNDASKQDHRPPGGNLDAYTAYLQGSKYWHEEDFPKAAEFMTRAVQLDPDYAAAWADLSGSWSTVAAFWNEPPAEAREHMRIARVAADKALQLAPALGSAHAAHAYLMFVAFDDRGALAECRRAVQLSPNDPMVLNGCGFVLTGIGKLGEALRLREHLLSIEPLYVVNTYQYAKLLMATGDLNGAEKYLRTSEELGEPSLLSQMSLAVLRGDAAAALQLARQAPLQDRKLYMAMATQVGPDRAVADRALADLLADKAWIEHGASSERRYYIAQVLALHGDLGQALDWLQRSLAQYPARARFLLGDPFFLRFRDDPRFIALCKQLRLPPPSESEALGIDQIRASLAAKR
jgi:TolB-like protein/DNA-binding winged helix-turn-helix (wHTH) protein/Tfp pilus assembly protein PilF